ncbi:DUF1700 domain-containing protein [Romboutsia lituseburensis]|uniref:DUF1700 domain-containing protein n=1 Tax=Romboutsia lituseburensis TaxID=1537 RepID=UPI00215A1EF0|nr:DUF1700 domain-containing protein [Romboutsia lituseburensis]MCR8745066.1 DUF1700 domain-containing protein [Romboutsia lituseburensis]
MNKIEFLEILKDYLKKDFSEDEINDILRDYEEYFVDGLIEGKNDMEIIEALGSPKAIANELISQIKKDDKRQSNSSDRLNDKFNLLKLRTRETYKHTKDYISEKLTPNINNKNHEKNRKWIQVILTILSIILIIPSIAIVITLAGIGIGLVGFLIIYIATIPLAINLVKGTTETILLYTFMSMAFIGGQILAWQIYIFLVSLCIKITKKYRHWIKTRNIYINASKKKEEYDKKELEEDYYKNLDKDNVKEEGDERYE